MAFSVHTTQSTEGQVKIPRLLSSFLKSVISKRPSNKRLVLSVFEPMEINEWCAVWIPVIYPDISAPTEDDVRRPRGYLAASKKTITALTQASDTTVENWIYGYRECPHTIKTYLRCIHIIWMMQGCFNFPVDFPKS